MTLIKSISGIRGTIGGQPGQSLTPLDVVRFSAAFASWVKARFNQQGRPKIAVGRDARTSGPMVQALVTGTLQASGVDVLDLGLSTTPSVEMAVVEYGCRAGIILTASHNPSQWNALKLLNEKGEFISAADGAKLLKMIEDEAYSFVEVEHLGHVHVDDQSIAKHIVKVLSAEGVDVKAIRSANLKVAVDAVNSTGGLAIPALLNALGVKEVIELYCEPNGDFKTSGAHLGVVVDPDVDRLALVCEDGSMFGEEYTLVAVADHVLGFRPGPTVSNLSSSRALRDVTKRHGQTYYASAVGEVNVVEKMKEVKASIGGEGNGGIIDPALHYGRDALMGLALFLTHYVKKGLSMTALKASYPQYVMSKNKIQLSPDVDVDALLRSVEESYSSEELSTVDGVKIDFAEGWVHLRRSNTEPIIRVYSEAATAEEAHALAKRIMDHVNAMV
jgi:phosphomannomutase